MSISTKEGASWSGAADNPPPSSSCWCWQTSPDLVSDESRGPAEYRVANWPATPRGKRWHEVTQDRDVPTEWVGREPIFAWEAKLYVLR